MLKKEKSKQRSRSVLPGARGGGRGLFTGAQADGNVLNLDWSGDYNEYKVSLKLRRLFKISKFYCM